MNNNNNNNNINYSTNINIYNTNNINTTESPNNNKSSNINDMTEESRLSLKDAEVKCLSDTECSEVFTDVEEQLLATPLSQKAESTNEVPRNPEPVIDEAELAMEKLQLTSEQAEQTTEMPEPKEPAQIAATTVASEATSRPSTSTANGIATERYGERRRRFFTTASKRRIRACIKHGMTPEEARETEKQRLAKLKSLLPDNHSSTSSKRTRSGSQTPDSGPSRKKTLAVVHSKTERTIEEEGSRTSPKPGTSGISYRDITATSKVAVIHEEYPEKLTDQQISDIKLNLMLAIEDATICPQFTTHAHREGWLSITCNTSESKNWILSITQKLKPADVNIRVVEGADIPKMYTCFTFVPKDEFYTHWTKENFIKRVAKQNPVLCTKSWRTIRMEHSKRDPGTNFVFTIDEASARVLETLDFRPFLNIGKIRVDVKGYKGKKKPGGEEAANRKTVIDRLAGAKRQQDSKQKPSSKNDVNKSRPHHRESRQKSDSSEQRGDLKKRSRSERGSSSTRSSPRRDRNRSLNLKERSNRRDEERSARRSTSNRPSNSAGRRNPARTEAKHLDDRTHTPRR
jgi:hypothetical protein